MAIHNATKLLLLRSQTKLTLAITVTLTDTVTVIFFTRTSLTFIKRFYHIYERNFSRRCVSGFVGGAIFLHYPAIALPICWKKETIEYVWRWLSVIHTFITCSSHGLQIALECTTLQSVWTANNIFVCNICWHIIRKCIKYGHIRNGAERRVTSCQCCL